jgi:aminoglycoside phosphotransferase (APT) family kinase protein
MAREYRVMSALATTPVPVPTMVSLCRDVAVIGAPFYVMSRKSGIAYRRREQLGSLGEHRVRTLAERLVATLANLHAVVPSDVGLGDFGRPHGFLERQVRRWTRQLAGSRSRDLAGADELQRLLEHHVPTAGRPAVVHGDFRLDNVLVDTSDNITAVLDWEMATVGDPLTDIALMIAYDQLARTEHGDGIADASTADGYPTAPEIAALYATATGADVSALGFHLGLAHFKLAAILEGIHYRYTRGQTVGDGFDRAGALVEASLAAGITSMKE